ncbi:hypothetical protein PEP31012_03683 [Pandoraea eparura]|uniref:Uncharacterized protein n=1 Tax=Pandoraea eparura TaxID=2508291 RepID=A0A5E4X4B0_9BURK|nr:hypothetical protein [Pandoraea eparura]VVE31134.1 hypothetical protein PEP31012_03683 [Pandoraea eparura]
MQTIATAANKKFFAGQKVVIGNTSIINDRKYVGLTGTVDFEFDTLVYVFVRAKGQRADRCICMHRDSLTLAS